MHSFIFFILWCICASLLIVQSAAANSSVLHLAEAEKLALADDIELQRRNLLHNAQAQRAISVSQLPNPKISLTALNLLVEQPFDFDAEPLTQGVIGISQRFPRGDTLNIQRLREERQGDSRLLDIQIRRDQLRKSVRREWVNVFEAQQRRTLLHGLHEVYAELMPIVTAQYEVGAGGQEEVLALRLKQAVLTDRITEQDSKLQQHRHRLREWIGDAASRAWPARLPEHLQRIPSGDVRQHPEIQRLTLQSRSQRHQVNLARQAYEPEYDLNARYGLRDGRSDVLSVGVNIDLPLFSTEAQDAELARQQHLHKASLNARDERIRALQAQRLTYRSNARNLLTRLQQWEEAILPEIGQMTQVVGGAYETGNASLNSLLKLRESDIQSREKLVALRAELARQVIELLYLNAGEVE